MKSTLFVVALLHIPLARAAAQDKTHPDKPEPKNFTVWMNVKVEESQKVFAALARADFNAIVESTERLKTVSTLEGFVRRSTPGYRTQLRSFQFAVADMQQQAKRENIEGVTMGFSQLTLSCVNCHKQLRRPPEGTAGPPTSGAIESER